MYKFASKKILEKIDSEISILENKKNIKKKEIPSKKSKKLIVL
jgi:hypothetical protein